MKQNADFQEGILQAKSAAKPLPTPKSLTTNESFQMRQYILLHNWASDWFHLLLTVRYLNLMPSYKAKQLNWHKN